MVKRREEDGEIDERSRKTVGKDGTKCRQRENGKVEMEEEE
jgi:hypothetical protein